MENLPCPLIVVGAGGHASELASFIRVGQIAGTPVYIRGFLDDHRFEATYEGAPILGGIDQLSALLSTYPDEQFLYTVAIGDNRTRAAIVRRIESLGAANLATWTSQHATAIVGDTVQIGAGSHIGPSAVITAKVTMGEHCIVNTNASISHDVEIGSFVNVSTGASVCGGVRMGEGCHIGGGVTLATGVQIGMWSVIGVGSVVMEDVPAHVTVEGVPARIVQRHARAMRQTSLVG